MNLNIIIIVFNLNLIVMKTDKFNFESIPLNLQQGLVRVTWDGMPSNLTNQIVAIYSDYKNVMIISPEWAEERKDILSSCSLVGLDVVYGDAFHVDTWDNKIANTSIY